MSLQNKIKNISKLEILLREIEHLPRYSPDMYGNMEDDDYNSDDAPWEDYLNRGAVINLIQEFIGDDNDI